MKVYLTLSSFFFCFGKGGISGFQMTTMSLYHLAKCYCPSFIPGSLKASFFRKRLDIFNPIHQKHYR